MGEFVEALAVRSGSTEQVIEAVGAWAAEYDVDATLVPGESEDIDSVEVTVSSRSATGPR